MCNILGRLEGFEPSTSRTTIWRYYQLSYSRREDQNYLSIGSLEKRGCRRMSARPQRCPPPWPPLERLPLLPPRLAGGAL
jgi:hypothetical protein